MAPHLPVPTTYVAGIPELVTPGESGWLVPAGSLDDLASAMEGFLECSPDELARMGEATHRRALERHSIDVEIEKLSALFHRYGLSPAF